MRWTNWIISLTIENKKCMYDSEIHKGIDDIWMNFCWDYMPHTDKWRLVYAIHLSLNRLEHGLHWTETERNCLARFDLILDFTNERIHVTSLEHPIQSKPRLAEWSERTMTSSFADVCCMKRDIYLRIPLVSAKYHWNRVCMVFISTFQCNLESNHSHPTPSAASPACLITYLYIDTYRIHNLQMDREIWIQFREMKLQAR